MTEPMTDERLAEIEKRIAKATPGPWRQEFLGGSSTIMAKAENYKRTDLRHPTYAFQGKEYCIAELFIDDNRSPNEPLRYRPDFVCFRHDDAGLIVAARNDIPDLIAEVKRLREREKVLSGSLRDLANDEGGMSDYYRARGVLGMPEP